MNVDQAYWWRGKTDNMSPFLPLFVHVKVFPLQESFLFIIKLCERLPTLYYIKGDQKQAKAESQELGGMLFFCFSMKTPLGLAWAVY